jgi:hypothetical protein
MIDNLTVRRIGPDEAATYAEALADVLVDCVEGGASVSFMLPLSHEKAVAFWRGIAEGMARGERALLVRRSRRPDSRYRAVDHVAAG